MLCAKSLYALKVLRSHGMPTSAVHTVFQALVMTKLTYCSCAWYGFCTAKEQVRLESFLRRCKRSVYGVDNTPTVEELRAASDTKLFQLVVADPQHMLNSFLPLESTLTYNLRLRAHNMTPPDNHSDLDSCNFVTRVLYANCY